MAELIIEPEAEAELEEAGDRYEESVLSTIKAIVWAIILIDAVARRARL